MVQFNYNFTHTWHSMHHAWFPMVFACKMPKFLVQIIIYTRRLGMCNLHEVRHATMQDVLLHNVRHFHKAWLWLLHTYVYRLLAEIYKNHCMESHNTVARVIVYVTFSLTLYVAGIVTQIPKSQLLHTFSQSRCVDQVVVTAVANNITYF